MTTSTEVVKEGYIPYEKPKKVEIPEKIEVPQRETVKVN